MSLIGHAAYALKQVQNQILRGLDGSTIDSLGERTKQQIRGEDRDRSQERQRRITEAGKRPDRRGAPERRCGIQSANAETILENYPAAEKADPGNDIRGDPSLAPVTPNESAHHHKHGGAHRDQTIRAQSSGALPPLPFGAHERSQDERDNQPNSKYIPSHFALRFSLRAYLSAGKTEFASSASASVADSRRWIRGTLVSFASQQDSNARRDGSIQIDRSGDLPSGCSGTHTRYRPECVVKSRPFIVKLVMLSPFPQDTLVLIEVRSLARRKISFSSGDLAEIGKIPTRSGSIGPRERAGDQEYAVLRWQVAELQLVGTTWRFVFLDQIFHI